ILVLNAGSSSLKFSLFLVRAKELELWIRGQTEGLSTAPAFVAKDATGKTVAERRWQPGESLGHEGAIAHLVDFLRATMGSNRLLAIGHRVVHGGPDYSEPVVVDADVVRRLEAFVPLAPLHQPHNLGPIRHALQELPTLPQVACFDTAFHRAQPEIAQAYALPETITARGVRRYGFHGLSYEYVAAALRTVDPVAADGRVVVAHLGNGASMCAMHRGRSVAATMGFSALEGLPMGTRCGSIDPGVLLYLARELRMEPAAMEKLLYQQSGLLGVSGVSSDMRALLASEAPRARFAVELFAYRIGRELGSLAAALGGLDALVFTGGIGEHAAPVRERVAQHAAWLGVSLDAEANARGGPTITRTTSRIPAYVIPTDEELMIARHTRNLIEA
ncbi:MAG TPA: acetate/propionate family kinase, partial [Myxococcaceae bacterium]|nr:acetate/propionate family kinase [Myxococcaceae bacterium]